MSREYQMRPEATAERIPVSNARPSLKDCLACAERELAMRKRVYPAWVRAGKMDANAAAKELAGMAEIARRMAVLVELNEVNAGYGPELL